MRRGSPSRVAILWLSALPLAAQAPAPASLTVDFVFSDEARAAARVPEFAWTSGDEVLLLDETKPPAQRTIERIRARDGKRAPAVDAATALASLAALSPNAAPKTLPWPEALNAAGTAGVYLFGDDLYLLSFASSGFTRLSTTEAKETLPRFSPDGRRIAFVRDNDLHVIEPATMRETRLTSDGTDTILNGTLSWVYWEEVFDRADTGYWWAPDSSAIAFLRTDESPVDVATFTDFAPAVPREIRQRYPRTGQKNPIVRLGIVPLAGGQTVWMDPTGAAYEYVTAVDWLPDSSAVAVQTINRAQTKIDIWRFDRGSGRSTLVVTDTDPPLIYQKELRFADGGKTWIVSFEKDGYTHLYRYGADGSRRNAVTQGNWSVRGGGSFQAPQGSAFVDGANGFVYFTSIEKSPLERHLYRIRLDGTGMARITREDGTHRITFSPDFRYFVDAYSNRDTLPALYLCDASGKRLATLWSGSMELLAPYGLTKRELVSIPAPDGFALPASLLRPPGFDPSKKYPVLIHVYGGPGSPIVQDRWHRDDLYDHLLAQNGYVVASFDPRSATGRNKELEDPVVGKMMSDVELEDLVAAVKWLKSQPWADPARFGIWGWSGGGSYTLLAMTRTQEFKAGISGAPVTDWDLYDTKFGEAYMKTRADNPEGYDHTSFVKRAKDLSGRLLLVFGSYDDNVHPQNAWAFADALIAAGKPFDIMVYPMQKHTFTSPAALRHRAAKMLEFWKLNL
jgi:dipeptidyl-peptidase-4